MAGTILTITIDKSGKADKKKQTLVKNLRDQINWKVSQDSDIFYILLPGGGIFATYTPAIANVPEKVELILEPLFVKITGLSTWPPAPATCLRGMKECEIKDYIFDVTLSQLSGSSLGADGNLARILTQGGDPPEIIIGS